MRTCLIDFLKREDGAVTTDWVVLTGMVVGLAIGFTIIFRENISSASIDLMEKTGQAALDAVDL